MKRFLKDLVLLPEKKLLLTLSYFFQYRNRGLSWFCYDQTSSLDFFTCFLNESILSNRFCLFFQSRFAIFYYSHYMGIQISIFFFNFPVVIPWFLPVLAWILIQGIRNGSVVVVICQQVSKFWLVSKYLLQQQFSSLL